MFRSSSFIWYLKLIILCSDLQVVYLISETYYSMFRSPGFILYLKLIILCSDLQVVYLISENYYPMFRSPGCVSYIWNLFISSKIYRLKTINRVILFLQLNKQKIYYALGEGGGAGPWAPQNSLQTSVFADEYLIWPGATSKVRISKKHWTTIKIWNIFLKFFTHYFYNI